MSGVGLFIYLFIYLLRFFSPYKVKQEAFQRTSASDLFSQIYMSSRYEQVADSDPLTRSYGYRDTKRFFHPGRNNLFIIYTDLSTVALKE